MPLLFLIPSHNARAYYSNTKRFLIYDETNKLADPSRLRPVQSLSSIV
jgi:hypothetical protein